MPTLKRKTHPTLKAQQQTLKGKHSTGVARESRVAHVPDAAGLQPGCVDAPDISFRNTTQSEAIVRLPAPQIRVVMLFRHEKKAKASVYTHRFCYVARLDAGSCRAGGWEGGWCAGRLRVQRSWFQGPALRVDGWEVAGVVAR